MAPLANMGGSVGAFMVAQRGTGKADLGEKGKKM
jgi:hypothetical protein